MTNLQRKWERKLEREGMPREPYRNLKLEVFEADDRNTYAASTTLAKWTALTHLVNTLPAYFHNRAILVTLCETGYVTKTAKLHKVSRQTVYRAMHALTRFKAQSDEIDATLLDWAEARAIKVMKERA